MVNPDDGSVIAELAWNTWTGLIATVRIRPEYRPDFCRKGIATALLGVARHRCPWIRHSPDRTADGDAWARSLHEELPELVPVASA
jgi:hypothetical protein